MANNSLKPITLSNGVEMPRIGLGTMYTNDDAARWNIQQDVMAIPKSVTRSRLEENLNVFDFELSKEDMMKIDGLNENRRFGPDPDEFVL